MKRWYISAIVLFFLVGCKKDIQQEIESPAGSQRTYRLKINVSNFTQKVTDLETAKLAAAPSSTPSNLNSPVNYLYLYLFSIADGDGMDLNTFTFVDSIVQKSSDPGFGSFSLKVPAGEYEVSVFGSPVPLKPLYYQQTPYAIEYENSDFFVGRIRGSSNDQDSIKELTLHREVAQLEVHIVDPMPESISRIELTAQNEGHSYDLSSYDTHGEPVKYRYDKIVQKLVSQEDHGKTNFSIASYILSTQDQYTQNFPQESVLTIRAYADNEIVAEKKIPELLYLLHKNKKTILQGKLFETSEYFTIRVDSVWAGRDTIPF